MKPEFRLIIAGTRTFNDYVLLRDSADYVLSDVSKTHRIVIISGTASGADKLGEKYGLERGYDIERFPADWNNLDAQPCKIKKNRFDKLYNALAGNNRNLEMANYALQANRCGCLVFWNEKSSGSKDMINIAHKNNISCIVKKY